MTIPQFVDDKEEYMSNFPQKVNILESILLICTLTKQATWKFTPGPFFIQWKLRTYTLL